MLYIELTYKWVSRGVLLLADVRVDSLRPLFIYSNCEHWEFLLGSQKPTTVRTMYKFFKCSDNAG